jgi:hypothetical protein
MLKLNFLFLGAGGIRIMDLSINQITVAMVDRNLT